MVKPSANIKTIIAPTTTCFAAFLPNSEEDIPLKICPIVAWALISFNDEEQPDEIIGEIAAGDAILEVTYVDDENGFGKFFGYFYDEGAARASLLATIAEEDAEDEKPANAKESSEEDPDGEEAESEGYEEDEEEYDDGEEYDDEEEEEYEEEDEYDEEEDEVED